MQQDTLPPVKMDMPSYTNLLYLKELEDKSNTVISSNTSFHTALQDSAASHFSLDLNWECFSNELEFE